MTSRARQKLKIVPFRGFEMRQSEPDYDLVHWYEKDLSRPDGRARRNLPRKGEFWIDHRWLGELEYFLRLYRVETSPRLMAMPYAQRRQWLKKHFTESGTPPEFKVRSKRVKNLTLCAVRGDIIRRFYDPHFYLGGHDLRYPDYIPANEVWYEIAQDPREVPHTVKHELDERDWMSEGYSYDVGHDLATDAELRKRARSFIVPLVEKSGPHAMAKGPIAHFEQQSGYCGPASLKIAADSLDVRTKQGRRYSEARLGRLSHTTADEGTDHNGLVSGALAIGLTVFEKSGGSIDELKKLLRDPDVRVIIGYHSPSDPKQREFDPRKHAVEDHFSVLKRITPRTIELVDPEVPRSRKGINRIPLEVFDKHRWWDTDGPDSADNPLRMRVERWYMAVNVKGKTFDIPGGFNHIPSSLKG